MATRTDLLTADEYLARVQRTHESSELVRGEVRPVSPAGIRHNVIAGNLVVALTLYLREHPIGRALTGNAGFRLPIPDAEDDTVRSPDVAPSCRSSACATSPSASPRSRPTSPSRCSPPATRCATSTSGWTTTSPPARALFEGL